MILLNLSIQLEMRLTMSLNGCVSISLLELAREGSATNEATQSSLYHVCFFVVVVFTKKKNFFCKF